MALVIQRAHGKAGFGKVDGSELDKPARFAGEAMDEGDDANDLFGGQWGPTLGEDVEASGINE